MLAKQSRLVKQKDFEKIFQQGRSYYSKLLGIKAMVNEQQENRYGIVISTKVSKKSTERNKLKRQIRHAIKRLDYELAQGMDIIVMALPAISGQGYNTIKSELERILIKLKLLKQ
ncbi:MAG: ribonuclease P protein component [bacterium]|nr:ribonuclease P protein component [bacterium]